MTALSTLPRFNAIVLQLKIPVAIVRYLPFISAVQSDISTVYTAILRLISVAESLGQPHIMVIANLVIYSIAQQIIWSKPELQEVIIRMF